MTNPSDLTVTIAELRRLLAEATPGPWEVARDFYYDEENIYVGMRRHPTVMGSWVEDSTLLSETNAALIVAAINALPALLDALEEAERKENGRE